MRKLVYLINVTLDGCFDHAPTVVDDELLEYCARRVGDAGLIIYGRITYEMMVPYWPDILKNPSGETKADVDFAQAFESVDKLVFSRTLDKAEGTNTRIVRTDLQEEILKLKKEEGKDLLVGGISLPSQLIALGLVDEFIFVVLPVIAGKGKRLMEGVSLQETLRLKLIDSKTLRSGTIALRHAK